MLIHLSNLQIFYRLGLAGLVAGLLGLEREFHNSRAGLRTYLMVGLGAALFTLVSAYGFADYFHTHSAIRTDPTRIAAQIASGIGFLGAGVIIADADGKVKGITTAAGLWIAAAIGMACGAGFYAAAIITSILTLFALGPLSWAKRYLPSERDE